METENKIVEIELYDKRQEMTGKMHVEKLADRTFRMIDNDIFNCRLTLGTEFETRINKDGKHEIVKIIKESAYVTRRFFLTAQFNNSEYRLLGDEILKHGGYWQVDFGGIATINLPEHCALDIDAIFKIFDFKPTEIIDDFR
jgi:hypothetical protein